MTTTPPEAPRGPDGLLRDLVSVLLLVLGVAGTLYFLGFSHSTKAGLGVLSVLVLAVGAAMAYRRRI